MPRNQSYLHNNPWGDGGPFVRAWRTRYETVVQVWQSGRLEGDPDGDWAMPRALGLEAAVEQAILQTPKPNKP